MCVIGRGCLDVVWAASQQLHPHTPCNLHTPSHIPVFSCLYISTCESYSLTNCCCTRLNP